MSNTIKENVIYMPFTSLDEQLRAQERIQKEVDEIIKGEEYEQEELKKEVEKELENYKREIEETYEIFNINNKEDDDEEEDIEELLDSEEGEYERIEIQEEI